jgi:hypothetical protein
MDRDELISKYFDLGLNYSDILQALIPHGYIISERHLRRILAARSLSRRKKYAATDDVIRFIQRELSQSGKLHGYRWMWQKCLQNGLTVRRDDVQLILSMLDPSGSAFR